MAKDPAPRSAYPLFRTFTTRWRDNDVYGHINNAVYYEYVDAVVNGWVIETGALEIPHGSIVCLVVESGCTYHAALAFPGMVEAGLRVDRIGRSAMTYGIGLFAAGGPHAAAEARFTHVCVDAARHRPVPIPARLREALETLRPR